jgi:hypothetical protein
VEVFQEVSEQRELQARHSSRSRRRPVPEAVVQRTGLPRDRPARLLRRRRGERQRAAAVVLEPVRGAGQGAAGALLHHAPLRHHARLLEGLAADTDGICLPVRLPARRRSRSGPHPPPQLLLRD